MDKNERRMNMLSTEYAPAFLAFSVKRCKSYDDALDLANEIVLNCIIFINKNIEVDNFNAYLWSIAHNTYKRYLNNLSKNYVLNTNYIMAIPEEKDLTNNEKYCLIRKALSYMVGIYRRVLVMYYYEELKIKDVAKQLDLTEEMVKFYLVNGRNKMKEVYKKMENIDEKSFNPKSLSMRLHSLDYNNINVWNIMSRALPQQIALICKMKSCTIFDISEALNVASCFIEDEIAILVASGLLIETTKGKYQTNFVIFDENVINEINNLYQNYQKNYIEKVNQKFEEILPILKQSQMFKYDAPDERYYAIFLHLITKCDQTDCTLSHEDYPILLTNGVRAVLYAYVEKKQATINKERLLYGQTSTGAFYTSLKDGKKRLWAIDLAYDTGHQRKLNNITIASAIYDVYNNKIDHSKVNLYAELISENYLIKQNGELYCNIAVVNERVIDIMSSINQELLKSLQDSSVLFEQILKIVKKNTPSHLKNYSKTYASIVYMTEADNIFYNTIFLKNKYLRIAMLKEEPSIPYFCHLKSC